MGRLDRIKQVALREIWRDEAHDFTPWLEVRQHLPVIAEALPKKD